MEGGGIQESSVGGECPAQAADEIRWRRRAKPYMNLRESPIDELPLLASPFNLISLEKGFLCGCPLY
jgi:hypothetical protein